MSVFHAKNVISLPTPNVMTYLDSKSCIAEWHVAHIVLDCTPSNHCIVFAFLFFFSLTLIEALLVHVKLCDFLFG